MSGAPPPPPHERTSPEQNFSVVLDLIIFLEVGIQLYFHEQESILIVTLTDTEVKNNNMLLTL